MGHAILSRNSIIFLTAYTGFLSWLSFSSFNGPEHGKFDVSENLKKDPAIKYVLEMTNNFHPDGHPTLKEAQHE